MSSEPILSRNKVKLFDWGLLEKFGIGGGFVLRIENDDWGKFIRVVDEEEYTVYGKLVINDKDLEDEIEKAKNHFK